MDQQTQRAYNIIKNNNIVEASLQFDPAAKNAITPHVRQSITAPMTFTLDNTSGTETAYYIIGDPTSIIASATSKTLKKPDSSSGIPADHAFKTFDSSPMRVGRINYKVSDPEQFSNPIIEAIGDIDGSYTEKPMPLAGFETAVANRDNLLTLNVDFLLSSFRALIIPVSKEVKAQITLTFTAAPDRG